MDLPPEPTNGEPQLWHSLYGALRSIAEIPVGTPGDSVINLIIAALEQVSVECEKYEENRIIISIGAAIKSIVGAMNKGRGTLGQTLTNLRASVSSATRGIGALFAIYSLRTDRNGKVNLRMGQQRQLPAIVQPVAAQARIQTQPVTVHYPPYVAHSAPVAAPAANLDMVDAPYQSEPQLWHSLYLSLVNIVRIIYGTPVNNAIDLVIAALKQVLAECEKYEENHTITNIKTAIKNIISVADKGRGEFAKTLANLRATVRTINRGVGALIAIYNRRMDKK
jgi:hypothetical protein